MRFYYGKTKLIIYNRKREKGMRLFLLLLVTLKKKQQILLTELKIIIFCNNNKNDKTNCEKIYL